MSVLQIRAERIRENIRLLNRYLKDKDKQWSLVIKILGGHKATLENILEEDLMQDIHSLADSNLSHLKTVKEINPDLVTMYIKPPSVKETEDVISYADISLNTSHETIEALNEEAQRVNKVHKVIIMIELGELREGILRENIINFYSKIFELSNITVIGIGTNLGCMYGVEPTYDKLMQLNLFNELIQTKFNEKLELTSGGSSITLPLLERDAIPVGVNHFRIGEAAFLGTSPFNNERFKELNEKTFIFKSSIIELKKKPRQPDGQIGDGNTGHVEKFAGDDDPAGRIKHYRAILDFGTLKVDPKVDLNPIDDDAKYIGTTSDMTVFDMGKKKGEHSIGNTLEFDLTYMGVAKLMYSNLVEKVVE